MPHPSSIDPSWVIQWCPFCYMTVTTDMGQDWFPQTPHADIEQVWEEHLAEHVEEMMAVTTQ